MNKSRLFLAAVAVGMVFAVTGCIFSQNAYIESSEFDLSLPDFEKAAAPVSLGVFQNLSGADRRYLCRRKDGQMVKEEYLRWLMSPELLLQRCMYGAFSVDPEAADKLPRVSCFLYRFEFDESAGAAKFSAEFLIERGEKRQRVKVDVSEPLKGRLTGASGATAMNVCVGRAFAELKGALKK